MMLQARKRTPAGRLEEYLALACHGVSERLPVAYFR